MVNCLHPVEAWICGNKPCKSDGVISPNLVFSKAKAIAYFFSHAPSGDFFRSEAPILGRMRWVYRQLKECCVLMPCGKCAACQIHKRKDMSTRLTHEASLYEHSCFVTLTYDDVNCPVTDKGNKTLCPSDVQKFVKRLRRHLEYIPKRKSDGRDHVDKVRYFAVGEYGSRTHRPHYHLIIFGWSPSDKVLFKTHNGKPVYRSPQLERLWKHGYSTISDVNPRVAKYCARYVTKKFARLEDVNTLKDIVPEFVLQSTRDGAIGAKWFDKYGADACLVGYCTYRIDDKICKAAIPDYYWHRLRRRKLPVWLKCRDDKIAFIQSHKLPCDNYDVDALKREVDVYRDKMHREAYDEFF